MSARALAAALLAAIPMIGCAESERVSAPHEHEIVATVAGVEITHGDLDARVRAIRRGPLADRLPESGSAEAQRLERWVVQLLATEHLMRHEARERGIPVRSAASARAGSGERLDANGLSAPAARALDEVAARVFEDVTERMRVRPADVRAYYRRNRDRYRRRPARRVRQVVLADQASALRVLRRIRAGADMAELARERSVDAAARSRGGDMGWLHRGEMVGAFERLAFSSEEGAVAGPARTEFGWHVIRVEDSREGGWVRFERVRRSIRADLVKAARGRAFSRWLERARTRLVRVEPGFERPGDPRVPDFVHRH